MAYLIQNSFNAGEITPRMVGRADLAKYQNGLETLKNATPLPHGGVTRRPGFKYIAAAKHADKTTRLVSFEFSVTQAYIIEFGDQYCRFYKDGGQILSGSSAYEIATPYREEDISTLKFAQSADVLYIAHPYYSPLKLSRTGHTSWTLTEIAFTARPSDWAIVTDAIEGATAANPVVITCTGHGLESTDQIIISGVVGMTELNGNLYNVTKINADTFSLQDATTDANINGSAYTAWSSGGTVDVIGNPSAVTLFEDRSIWAGVPAYPQSIYMSKAGDFEDMATGANDDDGLEVTISSDQVNAIRWMVSGKKLLIGTNGGEWWASGSGIDEPITPSSITIRRETNYGSENIQPISIGNNVVFVQRPGKTLRQWGYVFESDAYQGTDLIVFSEHLTKNYGVTTLAYQQSPNSVIWAIRSDGDLLSLTYMPEHEVYGWARHETAGSDYFESIATIHGSAFDELWAVTVRTVNGSTVRYIEQMQSNEWAYLYKNTIVITQGASPVYLDPETTVLIHSDDTDESQEFIDSSPSPKTIAFVSAEHDTAKAKFGASSINCYGGYIAFSANQSDFNLSDENFTITLWCYHSGVDADNQVFAFTNFTGRYWSFSLTTTSGYFYLWDTLGASHELEFTGTGVDYSAGWHHFAFVRSGDTLYGFQDGVLIDTADVTGKTVNYSVLYQFVLGAGYSLGSKYKGWIDEFYYIKGKALWTNNFTPPQQAYGSSAISAVETTQEFTTPENAFFVDSGLIYEGDQATITGATQAKPVVITAASHGFSDGDEIYIYDVVGMTELNGQSFKIANKTDDTFELTDPDDNSDIDGTDYQAYTSGGTVELKANVLSGLSHIDGREVSVLADGKVLENHYIQTGSLFLTNAASRIIVGLPYTTELKTLRPDLGQKETLLARTKRLNNIIIELYETFSIAVGPDENNLDTLPFENAVYPRGIMPGLFTGQKRIRATSNYNYDGQIMIRQTQPAPLTVLSIIKDVEVY